MSLASFQVDTGVRQGSGPAQRELKFAPELVPQHALEINLQSLKLRAVGVSLQTHEKSAPATNQDVVVSHVEPPFNVPQRGTFDEFNEKRASPQALRLSLPSALYLQYEALNT